MRAAKVQASLRIRAVSPEPPMLAHTSSESRGTFRQKARFLAPLNGWACAVKICNDGMLEDTNSLDGAHIFNKFNWYNCKKLSLGISTKFTFFWYANCNTIAYLLHGASLIKKKKKKEFKGYKKSIIKGTPKTTWNKSKIRGQKWWPSAVWSGWNLAKSSVRT